MSSVSMSDVHINRTWMSSSSNEQWLYFQLFSSALLTFFCSSCSCRVDSEKVYLATVPTRQGLECCGLSLIPLQTSFLCSIPNSRLIDFTSSLLASSFSCPDTPAILLCLWCLLHSLCFSTQTWHQVKGISWKAVHEISEDHENEKESLAPIFMAIGPMQN